MKDTAYLIITKAGVSNLRKTRPKLNSGEVAVRLRLTVPDEFFERIIPDAELIIPEEAVLTPPIEVGIEPTWKTTKKEE